ncbi:MAG TPA: hypothetical protein VJT14_07485 [Candidatus Dormibacteraeota bacterium]|nr:hypothetical protein [Candidatus Dormibacteraeota bacterium]
MANDSIREARRADAFARLQAAFPLKLSIIEAELPNGARLDDDEFLVRTAKDWGLSLKSLVLTTRRLFCPSDLTGRTTLSLPLTDVLSVTLHKHLIGFSTVVVDIRDGRQASFPAHINGQLVSADIGAAVDYAKRSAGLKPSTAEPSPRDRYELLREIIELRRSGVLTEGEFEKEKARILEQP